MQSLWQRLRQSIAESLQPREQRDRDLQHLQHPVLPAVLLPEAPLPEAPLPEAPLPEAAIEVVPAADHTAVQAHGEAPAAVQVVPAVPDIQHLQVDLPDLILQAMHRNS